MLVYLAPLTRRWINILTYLILIISLNIKADLRILLRNFDKHVMSVLYRMSCRYPIHHMIWIKSILNCHAKHFILDLQLLVLLLQQIINLVIWNPLFEEWLQKVRYIIVYLFHSFAELSYFVHDHFIFNLLYRFFF